MVKSQAKCKVRHAKHHYDYSVQGEVNLKLNKCPLIEGQGENVQISLTKVFSSKHIEELQEGPIFERKTKTSKVKYLHEKLKVTKTSKTKWVEVGRVRELYPHPIVD